MKNNIQKSRTSEIIGMKVIFASLLLLTAGFQASAQKSLVTSALTKYGVDQSFLDPANLRAPADRAFELKEQTTTAGKVKVLLAKFDPMLNGREQWTIVSVDGKAPSLYEINTFRNTREKPPVDKPDDASYRVDTETAEQLVISYKLDAASIPRDATFLKDCRAVLTIDLKSKQLAQLQLVNEKPVKIGPLTANKFSIVTKYAYDVTTKGYFPLTDNLNIEAAFLGKTVTTQVETTYSGYNKGR